MLNASILLVLPLRAYSVDGAIFIDEQACRGLSKWLDNFPAVVLACPTTSSDQIPPATAPIAPLLADGKLEFHPLPCAYSPPQFVRHLATTVWKLRSLIKSSRYLQFAIGGFWGDWGSVASVLAATSQRPYAVWTDRVESEVIRFQSQSKRGIRRAAGLLTVRLTQLLERAVIRRAGVGLFHGMDCYTAYAGYSRNAHLVDDIHFDKESHVSEQELSQRFTGTGPLHFIYAGRAHRDKGIYDWIEVLSLLATQGRNFQATWFGDGPELEKARAMVIEKSLGATINMPGAISHMEMLQAMKSADAFVFCHKTQESPRCLIEALACGLPLIGYHSEYASHLINQNEGGHLSVPNDIASLTATVADMFDGDRLRELSKRAARDGLQFTSASVFKHRSDLIKSLPLAP
jgi:glycosyltransferase involved in cell wall biosynthesis